MKKIFRVRIFALVLVMALLTQLCCFGYNAEAEEIIWSSNLVTQADFRLQNYTAKYLNVTLDQDTAYKLDFDVKFNKLNTTNLAVILRESGGAGYYLDLWASQGQMRLGSSIDGNGWPTLSNATLKTSFTFTQGQSYHYSIVMEPEKVTYYIDGNLIQVMGSDFQNHDYTVVTKVANGKCGFIAQNRDPDVSVSNVRLLKDKSKGDSGETETWSNNLISASDMTLTDYEKHFFDYTLDRDSAYKLQFDVTINNNSTTNFAVICREANNTGYYAAFWPSMGQIRISSSIDGNGWPSLPQSALVNNTAPLPMTQGRKYNITLVMEPEKIYLYIDGELVQVTLGNDGGLATSEYTPCSRIAAAKCGILMANSAPTAKFENIKLTKSSKSYALPPADPEKVAAVEKLIAAIGEVTKESGDAIAAAREAYDKLGQSEQEALTNYAVLEQAEVIFHELNCTQDLKLYALDATYAMGYNYWGSAIQISNVIGGGMHVAYENAGTNIRQAINRGVALDGLHAVFSNLKFTSTSKSIAFYFADLDSQESYTQILPQGDYTPLALVLDAAAGTLSIAYQDGKQILCDVIGKNDAWKYENIKEKQFDMLWTKNGEGYTVSLNGASAEISKAMIDRCNRLTQVENVYITLCAFGAGVSGSFDFLSLHDGNSACADKLSEEDMKAVVQLITKIASIGKVTVESEALVAECESVYGQMTELQQKCITNFNTLSAARYRLNSLTDSDLYKCAQYYLLTSEDVAGTNHWPNNLFVTDVPGGGVNFEWFNAGTNYRQLLNREIALDGAHLVFNHLVAENSNKKLALFLAGLYDTAADWTSLYSEHVQGESTCVELIFDFAVGTLTAHLENYPDVVVIRDSRLTYEFLEGVQWDMKVAKRPDGDYDITVAGATGVLPATMIQNAKRIQTPESIYVTLSLYGVGYGLSIDVSAIHGGAVVCADDLTEKQQDLLDAVIGKIIDIYDGNWQITPSSEEKIEIANAAYNGLPKELRALVSNLSDLTIAESVMPVVSMIDRLGDITIASADAIELAQDGYKLLQPAYRRLVGNYATLNLAINRLYQIRKNYILTGTKPDFGKKEEPSDQKPDVDIGDKPNTDQTELSDDIDEEQNVSEEKSGDDEEKTEKKKRKIKVIKKKKSGKRTIEEEYIPWTLIIAIAAGVVVLGGGTATALIIIKRKKQKKGI